MRHHVLFFIDLSTRRVEIAGVTRQPTDDWMQQVARNLTDAVDGFLRDTRYLITDRDPLFTDAFRHLLQDSGVKSVRLPARSPDLNPFAERFVLSIKSECLNRLIPLSESHLRMAISAYVTHYHQERNHQGLGNELIDPQPVAAADADLAEAEELGPVKCRERQGGLLRYYYRDAA